MGITTIECDFWNSCRQETIYNRENHDTTKIQYHENLSHCSREFRKDSPSVEGITARASTTGKCFITKMLEIYRISFSLFFKILLESLDLPLVGLLWVDYQPPLFYIAVYAADRLVPVSLGKHHHLLYVDLLVELSYRFERFRHSRYPSELTGICQVSFSIERRIHHDIRHRFSVELLLELFYRFFKALFVAGIPTQCFDP